MKESSEKLYLLPHHKRQYSNGEQIKIFSYNHFGEKEGGEYY